MTKAEQKRFIHELTKSIQKSATENIRNGKVPESWDGIELRWYLAELFERSAGFGDKRRKREYKNTVLVNDL